MAQKSAPSPRGPVARKAIQAPMPKPVVRRQPYPLDLNGPVAEPKSAVQRVIGAPGLVRPTTLRAID